MTRITIHPSRQSIHLPVTLEFIAAILTGTSDAGLPAGEGLTIELDSTGNVTVIRDDNGVFSYSHPRKRATKPADPAQLPLFGEKSA